MAKFTGLSEQYDGGRAIFVQQEGPHVLLSVQAGPDCNTGTTLITPAQARALSAALLEIASSASDYEGIPSGL